MAIHLKTACSRSLSVVGAGLLFAATGLLLWGTAFGGRSFGPIRFLLQTTPHGDKVGHFVLYGAIVFAVALVVRRRPAAITAALAMLLLGVADEFRQLLVGGRNFDLDDILANGAGICLGLLLALAVTNKLAADGFDGPNAQPTLSNG